MVPANRYVIVVQRMFESVLSAAAELRTRPDFAHLELVLLTTSPERYQKFTDGMVPLHIVPCDFADDDAMLRAIAPFRDRLAGVLCRGDQQVQYLRRLVPLLPADLPVASEQSLAIATDKRLMRQAFLAKYPEITPLFQQVDDASDETVEHIGTALGYPVIIKPANLASSLLIQACRSKDELRAGLQQAFAQLEDIYRREARSETPQLIVEQYLEGTFYSVDAYIAEQGQVYCCPPIGYVPATQIGIDDFFLYKRFAPSGLSEDETKAAFEATTKALDAAGLEHSSAHVELVRTNRGWKIIEIGPRLGRFRHQMYALAYGINHSLNDLNIHVGLQPGIPTKLLQYCSAYSIYPDHEGTLRGIAGIEELSKRPEVSNLLVYAKAGDACTFAKHGGHALAQFVISSADQATFATLTEWVEREVRPHID